MYGKSSGKPPAEYFEYFLGLMKKYSDYFFENPWPQEYDHNVALDITQDDVDFMFGGETSDFWDRLTTVCLKKNMCLKEGFEGYWGMMWTRDAIEKVVFHPFYEEVFKEFESLKTEGKSVGDVLSSLRKEYCAKTIHNSLIDFLRNNYPDKETRGFINSMLELLHSVEGVRSCGDSYCSWYMRTKYGHIKEP